MPAGPPGEPGSRGGVPGGNSRTLWLELSHPRLGAALSPWALQSGGRSRVEGRRDIKRWVQESPSVQPLITAGPPPEPGASPVSRGGGQEHLALRTRGRKWGWQVGGAPPCIPTLTLGTARKAFLSEWLRAGGRWRGGRKRHRWGPRGGRAGAPCGEPVLGGRAESEPQTPGSAGPMTGPPFRFLDVRRVSSRKALGGSPEAQLAGEGSPALSNPGQHPDLGRAKEGEWLRLPPHGGADPRHGCTVGWRVAHTCPRCLLCEAGR